MVLPVVKVIMQTSDTFRADLSGRLRGFTLLELLVVLALLGLLTGLAMPRMSTVYDRVRAQLDRDEAEQALSLIYFRVHERMLPLSLVRLPDETAPGWLEWPAGWTLIAKEPVQFFPSGYCAGGEVELSRYGQQFRYRLEPPFCRPQLIQ